MIKRLIRIELLLVIVLAAIYAGAYWTISLDQQDLEGSFQNLQEPAEGMRYMEYCQGGLSSVLTDAGDDSCVAERPGDFAKVALAVYAVTAALLFPPMYILFSKVRSKLRQ